MPDFSLEDWFNEFWSCYPTDLCDKKKGPKPPALRAATKIFKKDGEKELKRILDNMRALVKRDRFEKERGGTVYRWPFVSTFLNQGYYDNEIESYSEAPKSVSLCTCGEKAQGKCLKCHEKAFCGDWKRMHLENLKSMGLQKRDDETKQEWALRCRQYAKQYFSLARRFK